MIDRIGRFFCRKFHHRISRVIHGRYRCWVCLREYKVDWDRDGRVSAEIREIPPPKMEPVR